MSGSNGVHYRYKHQVIQHQLTRLVRQEAKASARVIARFNGDPNSGEKLLQH